MGRIEPTQLSVTVPKDTFNIQLKSSLFYDTETGDLLIITDIAADEYLAEGNDPDRYIHISEVTNE